MDISVSIEDETTGETHEVELQDDVEVKALITAILEKIHPEIPNTSGWRLMNVDRKQTCNPDETLADRGTKSGARLRLSKTYAPLEDGLLVEEASRITTLQDCASVNCEYDEFNTTDMILSCPSCQQLLIRCPQCETLNRIYGKYCRSCKHLLTGKRQFIKIFYDNLTMPLATEFPTVFTYRFMMPEALSTTLTLDSVYGKLLVMTPRRVVLVNPQPRNPGAVVQRNIHKTLSEEIPLEAGEFLHGRPCITDDAVYLTTNTSLLRCNLKDFDQLDGVKFEKVLVSDDGILDILCLPEQYMAVLTKSSIQIYDPDFEIVTQQEEGQETPHQLLPYAEARETEGYAVTSQFLGISQFKTFLYRWEEGQLNRTAYSAENNNDKNQLISLERTIFYLKDGSLYSEIPSPTQGKMLSQPIHTAEHRDYHRLYLYFCGNVTGIIAEYDSGWDFYSPYSPYQKDEMKSKEGVIIDASVSSVLFGKFFLCGVQDPQSFELKVAIFDLEKNLRLRYSAGESYQGIYAMTVSLDRAYILSQQGNQMELVGYTLT